MLRTIGAAIGIEQVELRELSARQALLMEQEGQALAQSLCVQEIPAKTARAVAQNAALCAYSLQVNGVRRFHSAGEAAEGLSLLQLAELTQCYKQAFMPAPHDYNECGVNEQLAGLCQGVDTDV